MCPAMTCFQILITRSSIDVQNGNTALMFAAANGRENCARLLMVAGADKEAKNHVRVAGCFAADISIVVCIHARVFARCVYLCAFAVYIVCWVLRLIWCVVISNIN
jgi:hypothetical protein